MKAVKIVTYYQQMRGELKRWERISVFSTVEVGNNDCHPFQSKVDWAMGGLLTAEYRLVLRTG
ncbi:MAG: hypothetical protein OXN17_16325 [Candidatus Poribacteria bacterium]|nr:hypothetical protein [Candidatus Poribacteria bacterium]